MNELHGAQRVFQVDLGGIIDLLSRSLYSSPAVYLRELLQNAVDAVAARVALTGEAPMMPIQISPIGVACAWSSAAEFTITDPGIGIAAEDVQTFLATVGASSKKSDILAERRTYLGQFGIGLLSCFLVADEITVISQHAAGGSPIEWIGKSDGTYTTRLLDDVITTGTTVVLRPRPDMIGWVRPEQVLALARKYAEFLPAVVEVITRNGAQTVTVAPPWQQFGEHLIAVRRGVTPKLGGIGAGKQFDAILLNDSELELAGVVYIGKRGNRAPEAGRNRVYIGGMLVEDDNSTLSPSWATFAWVVLNCSKLSPTASRESLVHDHIVDKVREKIAQAILQWLTDLAHNDPDRFAEFVAENRAELLRGATNAYDPDGLQLAGVVLPMLEFETTAGIMRLSSITEQTPELFYAATIEDFHAIQSFNPSGRIVINGGYTGVIEALYAYAQILPDITLARAYPAGEIMLLPEPPLSSRGLVNGLIARANRALETVNCEVAVRRLPVESAPSIFLDRGQLDTIATGRNRPTHLVLNWENNLVRRLAELQDDLVFERVVQLLYAQARMATNTETPTDRELLSSALGDIMALAVGLDNMM